MDNVRPGRLLLHEAARRTSCSSARREPLKLALRVALGLASAASEAPAQAVRGTVTSQRTGQPVAGALVQVLNQQGAEVTRAQRDAEGRYGVLAPAPGTYRLRFLVPGYRPLVSLPLQLAPGLTLEYPLQLTAAAPESLDTLIVEGRPIPAFLAPFYRRRGFGLGRFVTRDEIERSRAGDVSLLARRLNALDVLGDPGDGGGRRVGSSRHGRFCPAAVYVNGTYAGMSGQVDLDLFMPLDHVEAVEVYRASEVGADFPTRGCGVVALWSRLSDRDTTGILRHLGLALHGGVRVGEGGIHRGRLGGALAYTISQRLEIYPSVNVYLGAPDTSPDPAPSGWQATLALRALILGGESPWYVGTGLSHLQVGEADGCANRFMLLTGAALPGAVWRPYIELQALDPLRLATAHTSMFIGLAYRAF